MASVLFAGLFVPEDPPATGQEEGLKKADTAWLLAASALVMFMTPGLAFFYGGLVDHKNIIATMMQSLICLGLVGVLWVVVGFSLAFGPDCGGFIGNPWTHLWLRGVGATPSPSYGATIPFRLFAAFQLKFAVLTPGLTAGGYIERFRFAPYLLFVVLFSLLIYCPVAHWVWSPGGFLHQWGFKDFAGGTVVHMTAGFSALAGCVVVGPRQKFHAGDDILPVNVTYVVIGTGMLWFGWFGFNAGSELAADTVAAQAFLNTNAATAAAMAMWEALLGLAGKKLTVVGACMGALCGLVAITPACGFVTVGESLFIGGFASAVCYGAAWLMHRTPVDDGLDAFAAHGVGGLTGCILTAVFMADVGVVHGPPGANWRYFGRFWAAVAVVGAWAFAWSLAIFKGLDMTLGLRMSPEEEEVGLDEVQHGEGLYKGSGLKVADSAVAEQCAEAIAQLEFAEVAWLRSVAHPSRIQSSFLRMIDVLQEVKPFVPDHVFAALFGADGSSEGLEEAEAGAVDGHEDAHSSASGACLLDTQEVAPLTQRSQASSDNSQVDTTTRSVSSASLTEGAHSFRATPSFRAKSSALPSTVGSAHHSLGSSECKQRRCAYLVARIRPSSPRSERLALLGEMVAQLVRVGKEHQATIDQVTLGAVAMHWGLLGSAAGAALKAVAAALQMAEGVGGPPPGQRGAPRLQVAVGYGVAASGTVKAAGHSFFVVGGALVDLLTKAIGDQVPERMGCSVLITEAVRQEVQYHVACSPRLWYADALWFQPTHLRRGSGQNDEWMYELQQMTYQDGAVADALLELLKKIRLGKSSAALRNEVCAVRERFGAQLSAADNLTLSTLVHGFQSRLKEAPSQSVFSGSDRSQRSGSPCATYPTSLSSAAQRWRQLASQPSLEALELPRPAG